MVPVLQFTLFPDLLNCYLRNGEVEMTQSQLPPVESNLGNMPACNRSKKSDEFGDFFFFKLAEIAGQGSGIVVLSHSKFFFSGTKTQIL